MTTPSAGDALRSAILGWTPEGDSAPPVWRPDELATLEAACSTANTIHDLEVAAVGAPAFIEGPRGRTVVHPVAAELRHQRATLAALLARLHLPEGGDVERLTASERGRRAARARWS